jgi:sulfite exporter TauE/SafE
MCGSIIGTLTISLKPEIRKKQTRLLPFVFTYNIGRICSYTLAGLLIGIAEYLVISPFDKLLGYRVLQIFSAIIMLGAGFYIAGWLPRFAYIEKVGLWFWKILEPMGRKLLPVDTLPHAFLFGMIWGWLPCGLVYTALAYAATLGDIVKSATAMLMFGIGTLPAVAGFGIMATVATRFSRMNRIKQLIGVMMIALALLAAFPWMNPMRMKF